MTDHRFDDLRSGQGAYPFRIPIRIACTTCDRQSITTAAYARAGNRCYPNLLATRPYSLLRIDPRPGKTGAGPEVGSEERSSDAMAEAIVCRQCLHEITASTESRIINGAHAHTFANPEGIVFEIVCYRDAWGCGYIGPTSSEFTWFSGHVWRIAVCAGCHTHVGWLFASSDGHHFHGLIASRIIVRQA